MPESNNEDMKTNFSLLRKIRQRVLRFVSKDSRSFERAENWEAKWAIPEFDPVWRVREIPQVIQTAVEQRWWTPASRLLDIGCGSGECADWLAEHGFDVLGIDFAPSAIHRAQAACVGRGRVQFQVLDICRTTPATTFESLLDRGCYHTIPAHQRADYVRRVAAAADPCAHFLLLHRIRSAENVVLSAQQLKKQQSLLVEQLHREFQTYFEIDDIQPTELVRPSEQRSAYAIPGIAVRLVRI